jgi:8-oxo-dGTP diphosphatase
MKKVIRVVGCILKHEDEVLMLLRSKSETDSSLWGIPAGKSEGGESDLQTVIREVNEETSIELNKQSLQFLGVLPIEYDNFTVVFPIFAASFATMPIVKLSPREHIDYRWMKPKDILGLPNLMKDVDIIVKEFCISKLRMIN